MKENEKHGSNEQPAPVSYTHLKTRQPVYISQEIHRSVIKLVHLLALAGKEISVG